MSPRHCAACATSLEHNHRAWMRLDCETSTTSSWHRAALPLVLWLCPTCAETPEESRALAALRHPDLRFLP